MVQAIQYDELTMAQKARAVSGFHRDTGRDRSFVSSLRAFKSVLASIPHWDAETGEPSLDSGNFPQRMKQNGRN